MVSTHTDNPARSLDCPRWTEAVEASCNVESLASEGVLGEGVSEFVSPGLAQNVHSLKLDILLRSSDVCSVLALQIITKSLTLHDIHNDDLEIEVERLRTEISIAEQKADTYRKDIANLQSRIDVEKTRLAHPELDGINDMIAALKRMIPTVQGEIDRHYYYCYGAGA